MGYFNQKVLSIAMAVLVLAIASCTSKPESNISQTEQQTQESSMAAQEQEEPDSSTTVQSPEEPSTTPQEAAQVQETSGDSKVITVIGTVRSDPDGMFITADEETYAVSGRDLSDMDGMTVQITGALKESEGMSTIDVTDVTVVE